MFLQVFCSELRCQSEAPWLLDQPYAPVTESLFLTLQQPQKEINSTLNTIRILSPGLNFSICAEELMSGLGLLHKDRREFLQAFQGSGERQVLGAVGHP